MEKFRVTVGVFVVLLLLFSCSNDEWETPASEYLLFPAGRSFLSESEATVLFNNSEYIAEIISDSCGGFWFKIPKVDLPPAGGVEIHYKRQQSVLDLYKGITNNKPDWINPSLFIDSDNSQLQDKALELIDGIQTNYEKAKSIQQFVINHLEFREYKDSFLEIASDTYQLGYGTCMNFSRLFVAMCRAVNIPARSIWGIVYGYDDDNIYDYHHQWAEMLDDNGYWHPLDFNYTTDFDLNDIRYLDLVYAAEENTVIHNRGVKEVMLGNVSYFENYPATLTGKLGFELVEDARPEYMIIKYNYN